MSARQQDPTDVDREPHEKVICISMYSDDLKKLDALSDELKARGLTGASRSELIRNALTGFNSGVETTATVAALRAELAAWTDAVAEEDDLCAELREACDDPTTTNAPHIMVVVSAISIALGRIKARVAGAMAARGGAP